MKIVSGGQTGVDRAALDAALNRSAEIGGWCPQGRRAEDGVIDEKYTLQETPKDTYRQRTQWNVRDSDGTLVLTRGVPVGGTAQTIEFARDLKKPYLVIDMEQREPSKKQIEVIKYWVSMHAVQTLNVAGPREINGSTVYKQAYEWVDKILEMVNGVKH